MEARLPILLLIVTGSALSQGISSFQALVDATPDGDRLFLDAVDYEGPATLRRSILILPLSSGGERANPTIVLPQGHAGSTFLLVVDDPSASVTLRDIALENASTGVHVRRGALAIDRLSFLGIETPVRVDLGAIALADTVAGAPTPQGDGLVVRGRWILPLVRSTEGESVPGATVTLRDDKGAPIFRWKSPISVFFPHDYREAGGNFRTAVNATYFVEAPGYRGALVARPAGTENLLRVELARETESVNPLALRALVAMSAAVVLVAVLRAERARWTFFGFVAALYSRIRSEDALANPTRARVHALVSATPGIHYRALHRAAGISHAALAHHLRTLHKTGLIEVHRSPSRVRFAVVGAATSTLSPPDTTARVHAHVVARPGTTPSALADALGLARPLVAYHLDRLEREGRLRRERRGREVHLFATEPGSGAQP